MGSGLRPPLRTNTRAHTARPRTANPTACPLHYRPFYYLLPYYCPPTATLAARSSIRNSSPHLFDRSTAWLHPFSARSPDSAREVPLRMPAHYIHGTVVLVVVCTYALQANIAHSSAYCYSYRPHSPLPTVCIPLPTPFPAPKVYDTQKPVCLFCLLWFRVYILSVVVPCLYLLLFSLLPTL